MAHNDVMTTTSTERRAYVGPASSTARRAVVSGTVGSALEWFDFSIYGILSATVFPQLFFSDLEPGAGLLASFAVFGAGFFARPLGGVVFGILGDRLGRRNVLMFTLVLMGGASAVIGLLPTFGTIGVVAPALLILLRFLQGFALGGESTGSQVLVMEHAPQGRRGFYGALMMMGSPISQVIATLTLTGLAAWLTEEQFESWGWRLPFLLSFLLIGVGYYIRRKVEETPVFLENAKQAGAAEKPKALAVLKDRPGTVVALILSWAAPSVVFYICVVFASSYLTNNLGFDKGVTFAIVLIGNMASVFAGVMGGKLSDRIGRKKVFIIALVGLFIAVASLFPIMDTKNLLMIAAVIVLALSSVQFMAGAMPAFFAEAFPTSMRFTGSALGLSGGTLFFGATTPFIATWLLQTSDGNTFFITLYGLVIIAVSSAALFFLKERYNKPLDG